MILFSIQKNQINTCLYIFRNTRSYLANKINKIIRDNMNKNIYFYFYLY